MKSIKYVSIILIKSSYLLWSILTCQVGYLYRIKNDYKSRKISFKTMLGIYIYKQLYGNDTYPTK